jgi:hypothetical protein
MPPTAFRILANITRPGGPNPCKFSLGEFHFGTASTVTVASRQIAQSWCAHTNLSFIARKHHYHSCSENAAVTFVPRPRTELQLHNYYNPPPHRLLGLKTR